jgi:CHRD domain
MHVRHRATVAGAVSLAALLAVGAPLIAQSSTTDPPAKGKGPVHTKPVKDPAKGKPKFAPKGTTFFATLLGRNEIGPNGQRRAGDLDGQGGATVVTTDTQLCFGVAVRGISTPTGLHVHRGRPNENGGIVVPLDPLPTSGDPGASGGCVAVASDLLQEITKHPIRFYVNIHTSDFENGALRGQLHRAPRRR